MIDAVAIPDQGVGDAAEIEQAKPVGTVARHAGDFEPEHDAGVAEAHFRNHACEPRTLGESCARHAQIFVNDDHLIFGPTEFLGLLEQSILARGGLAVVFDLSRGGLANVDEGGAFRMAGRYFDQIINDFPPERGCLRPRGR